MDHNPPTEKASILKYVKMSKKAYAPSKGIK